MNTIRLAVREALGIVFSAAVLGFGYTALTEQGLFAESASSHASAVSSPTSVIRLPEARTLFESATALFIDSRHEFDYRMGHIAHAINIPLAEADGRLGVLSETPRNKILVVYCDGAECNSSFALAARLQAEGFSDVRIFFGGWNEWQSNSLPSEGAAR